MENQPRQTLQRARWARLAERFPDVGLKHGVWYPIRSTQPERRLVCVEIDGEDVEVRADILLFSEDRPSKATVFSPGTFGEELRPTRMMSYVGICPEGHHPGGVRLVRGMPLRCSTCRREYDWEFE